MSKRNTKVFTRKAKGPAPAPSARKKSRKGTAKAAKPPKTSEQTRLNNLHKTRLTDAAHESLRRQAQQAGQDIVSFVSNLILQNEKDPEESKGSDLDASNRQLGESEEVAKILATMVDEPVEFV